MKQVKDLDFNDLFSKDPKVKYGTAKEYKNIALEKPVKIYPLIDKFIGLLDNENNILQWTAIDIIGLVSSVDKDCKIDMLIKKLYKKLNGEKVVTVNHVIECLSNIAKTKPEYKKEITKELLKIKNYEYETEECKNIIYGKLIDAFSNYIKNLSEEKSVINFIEEQKNNERNSTKKKAEKILKKYGD